MKLIYTKIHAYLLLFQDEESNNTESGNGNQESSETNNVEGASGENSKDGTIAKTLSGENGEKGTYDHGIVIFDEKIHSSEIRGLCLMKLSSETLQKYGKF